ncbi:serine/threonine-protein kinase [Sulfolobus acidocaldarius]|uniref:Conserved protein n=4 Tax=Sulfolobus acidocaldarius TaxID=2285 RepID=Q4J9X9_SULAC|nr:serine/threonine-protein kinase [Sulfolobus acidocaldarius]AAY80398.1 conserved protein [Sulfolobus acidocaldarius DSM 639]AGE70981.1 hypothetical protein SacN8_05050 [Sulfolobus acidocaldarius N8]AGE73252.1 hypothetical protein SacRon12I_05040 [Sulfolobus acidocaldarius Ron12/I]ALU28716.1 hypothetical protein ATY89_01255 [Sulfolobus acidocaldarius]ALU31434.1 hypothetical protein ATZ20_04290 [Sulfolobus acidocaldarius]
MNRRLLVSSAITLVILPIFYYELKFSPAYVGIIALGIILSFISAFIKRVSIIAGIFIVAISLVFSVQGQTGNYSLFNIPYLGLVLPFLLGLPGIAIPEVWGIVCIIGGFISSLVFPTIQLPIYLATLTSLAYFNLSGRGYPTTIVVKGLPKGAEWSIEINGTLQKERGNKVTIKEKSADYLLCPQLVENTYYLPDVVSGKIRKGQTVVIKFKKSDNIPFDKYPHCISVFRISGLPTGINSKLNVNGQEYDITEGQQLVVPALNEQYLKWKVEEVTVGDVIFKPVTDSGIVKRGSTVTINFKSLYKPTPKQKVSLPSLNNWDPKIWINKEIYGYKVIDVVGQGGNGYVVKAERESKYYAIKILSPENLSKSSFDTLFKESENLKELSKNDKIVSIYGIYADSNYINSIIKGNAEAYFNYPPAIIMEFMDGGTIADLINEIRSSPYFQYIVKAIIREVGLALKYLHKRGYVHLDVKPRNIFLSVIPPKDEKLLLDQISSRGIIKLGDLGSAVRVGEKITQATPAYSPPEQIEAVITGKGAQPSMDNYALGVTAYYLLTGNVSPITKYVERAVDLYLQNKFNDALEEIDNSKKVLEGFKPSLPINTLPELNRVIQGTILSDPTKRLTSDDIVQILS